VIQIEVCNISRHLCGIGQAGSWVFRRVLGDATGRCNRLFNRCRTQVCGIGGTFSLSEIHGHTQTMVIGMLDGLGLSQAYGDRQALLGRHTGLGSTGPLLAGLIKQVIDDLFKAADFYGIGFHRFLDPCILSPLPITPSFREALVWKRAGEGRTLRMTGQALVPPTVSSLIFRVGWPTPTGTV